MRLASPVTLGPKYPRTRGHILLFHLRLRQTGVFGPHINMRQEQDVQVIPWELGALSVLRLAELVTTLQVFWTASTQGTVFSTTASQSQSFFTNGGQSATIFWYQAAIWDSQPARVCVCVSSTEFSFRLRFFFIMVPPLWRKIETTILPLVLGLRLNLIYDRRSVGQCVLVSNTLLWPLTRFIFCYMLLFDNCVFLNVGHPHWRVDRSAICLYN
jgi:hypothetical protein